MQLIRFNGEADARAIQIIQDDPREMLTMRAHTAAQAMTISLAAQRSREDASFTIRGPNVEGTARWLASLATEVPVTSTFSESTDPDYRAAAFFGKPPQKLMDALLAKGFVQSMPEFGDEFDRPSAEPPMLMARHRAETLDLHFHPDIGFSPQLMIPFGSVRQLGDWVLAGLEEAHPDHNTP